MPADADAGRPIYLDYNATTPLDPAVAAAMLPVRVRALLPLSRPASCARVSRRDSRAVPARAIRQPLLGPLVRREGEGAHARLAGQGRASICARCRVHTSALAAFDLAAPQRRPLTSRTDLAVSPTSHAGGVRSCALPCRSSDRSQRLEGCHLHLGRHRKCQLGYKGAPRRALVVVMAQEGRVSLVAHPHRRSYPSRALRSG